MPVCAVANASFPPFHQTKPRRVHKNTSGEQVFLIAHPRDPSELRIKLQRRYAISRHTLRFESEVDAFSGYFSFHIFSVFYFREPQLVGVFFSRTSIFDAKHSSFAVTKNFIYFSSSTFFLPRSIAVVAVCAVQRCKFWCEWNTKKKLKKLLKKVIPEN